MCNKYLNLFKFFDKNDTETFSWKQAQFNINLLEKNIKDYTLYFYTMHHIHISLHVNIKMLYNICSLNLFKVVIID